MADKGIDIVVLKPGDTTVQITVESGLVFDVTLPPVNTVILTTGSVTQLPGAKGDKGNKGQKGEIGLKGLKGQQGAKE